MSNIRDDSTWRAAGITFPPLEITASNLHRNSDRAVWSYGLRCFAGYICCGYERLGFQAMGVGGDPGRRAAQTGGHVCKGSVDPHHRKIDIHG